jgi:hypothetical protein
MARSERPQRPALYRMTFEQANIRVVIGMVDDSQKKLHRRNKVETIPGIKDMIAKFR